MGDERGGGGGIETAMGNQNGGVAAKKRKKQRRREDATDGNGEVSDDDPNYQYVSIVDVNPSPSSPQYESAATADDTATRQLIEVNKCSVVIGDANGLSRVSRVSVNGEFEDAAGDIPNGVTSDHTNETSLIGQVGILSNGTSSLVETVSDSSSSLSNRSSPCGQIINSSSTNEESLDPEENEIYKSDVAGSPSVIDLVDNLCNGSSVIEIVSDLSFSSATVNGCSTNNVCFVPGENEISKSDIGDSASVTGQVSPISNGSSLVEIVSDFSSPTRIPNGGSSNNECDALKENEFSKSGNGVPSLVIDQVSPLSQSSSVVEIASGSPTSRLELPCSEISSAGQVSSGESVVEIETSISETGCSPPVNGHSNGLSPPNGSSSPLEQSPSGLSSTSDLRLVEASPRLADQNGLSAEDSLEERLARAVRETLDGLPEGVELTDGLQEEVERVVREKLKRQRSGSSDCWNYEDNDDHCIVDFLDKINDHAEARLAAKRQARAEAREIRMRELERMQRESEDGDRVYDAYPSPVEAVNRCVRAGSVTTPRSLLSSNNSYHSSRRSSEDSLEEVNSIRDARHELRELEEKFRKAMIANAQLDNEKAAIAYQADLFKDRYEELEEQNLQLAREHKETCRQLEQTKRHRTKLQEDLEVSRTQLSELLQLVQEKGLVVVEGDCSSSDEESEGSQPRTKKPPKKALVSAEVADVLQQGSGSLDVRLKKFVEERNELLDELRRVKLELEEERAHSRGRHANGPTGDTEDIQREANKLLGDYKFKMQKAEQDVNTLQANVARLESQVVRYKSAAETSEKLEGELKLEKRKLQRELREAQSRVEELETSHSHLQRRLDKLKNAKSALLKDL